MNHIRLRFSALLVIATLSVVILATGLLFLVSDKPDFSDAIDAIVTQIDLSDKIVPAGLQAPLPDRGQPGLHTSMPAGHVLVKATDDLRKAMAARSMNRNAVIEKWPQARWPVVSFERADGLWLSLPVAFPGPPGHSPLYVLSGWMVLIAAGVSAIAVFAVHRMTRPLALVENAVANMGPGGEMPVLPETGPGEVRVMAQAINQLMLRLRSATESRMRLVAAAGHDLRTPLTRMRLRAELLDHADQEKWLNDLEELDRIADSAISLVREETESPPSEGIRINHLIGIVVDELHEMHLPAVLMRCDVAVVWGQPLALKRALTNLAINAATHGKGAAVSLVSEASRVTIMIEDNGPGIPDHLLQQVYEPFFRVDAARRTPLPGAGLGLAIAKEILDRNGASLTLANRRGGGLMQTIVFPVKQN